MNSSLFLINLGTSANIINSGGQSIKFVRPQQTVQKVHQSIPPLSPRVTQTTGIVQVRFLKYLIKVVHF